MTAPTGNDWDSYLAWFHDTRPGITEEILGRSFDSANRNAYDWIIDQLPATGTILEVACGSAPIYRDTFASRYVGVDTSAAEVAIAQRRGAHRVMVGSATDLPLSTGSVAAVVCSMALMILPDLDVVLKEIRRVLHPDGVFLATMPTAPAGVQDTGVAVRLLRAVGGDVRYRNDSVLRHADRLFLAHGLGIVEDSKQRYEFAFDSENSVKVMAESLYLRTSGAAGERDAERVFSRLARHGGVMPVPIRRVLARPIDGAGV
ncbi:MAG: class I SAM-dependent methyltransferase [Leifsonia sp.]